MKTDKHGYSKLLQGSFQHGMGVDNFFVVGGAYIATPNFMVTPTYYWIATVAVVRVINRLMREWLVPFGKNESTVVSRVSAHGRSTITR